MLDVLYRLLQCARPGAAIVLDVWGHDHGAAGAALVLDVWGREHGAGVICRRDWLALADVKDGPVDNVDRDPFFSRRTDKSG